MGAQVIPIHSRFDPASQEAEARYDRVAHRMNQLCAAGNRSRRIASELERQFVENDLKSTSGVRRGKPLTPKGRRLRLQRLFDLQLDLSQMEQEREYLSHELAAMNAAIEAWARDTYGGTELEDPFLDSPPVTKS